jgi:hypothetical protein
MSSTYLQRKNSERGASLILLVSIIGVAFIVTVAAFLVAASNGQATARLASAKVDIATREDALMREILQQTATGMLPGTDGVTGPNLNWTTIMTKAANNLSATTYVSPAEVAALPGLAGVIPDNMADTGGALLGIFQGYDPNGDPFGGTSGLANVVPSYDATVQPPLMNWSNSAILSSANATTTPQEFFLGSQYSSSSSTSSAPVTNLSTSNRWGQITYPNIRFGYKQPGNPFIARRVWWRIPVVYQTAQQTIEDQAGVNRYPSAPANYVLSVYEIPSQLPISGNANLQIGADASGTPWASGNISITGSVSGNKIQLSGGTYSGVSSRQAVTVSSPTIVNGVAYANSTANSAFDQPGTREQLAVTQTPGVAAPVSVVGNDGKVLLVPVMPGNDFYMAAPGAPTHWDLYARPYYRCRIRVIISGTDSTLIYNSLTGGTNTTTAGAITVDVYTLADTASPAQPDQILGFQDSAATHTTYQQTSSGDLSHGWPIAPNNWMTYTSTGTGTGPAPTGSDRNLLIIDVLKMVQNLGTGNPAQLYSIYIGSNPTAEPNSPYTASDPGVAITDTNDLHLFTSGLSIVTNQTLYLLDSFNQGAAQPSTSLYAPQVRYGMSAIPLQVNLTGQVAVVATPSLAPVNPLNFTNGNGISISSNITKATLTEVTNPTLLPPITALNLLFTIEKERTN